MGRRHSSVRIAMPQAIPSASPLVPVSCAVASAATIRLTVGTVMERSHMPLSTWFWAAYLVEPDARHLGRFSFSFSLACRAIETAFGILHKLRSGMVRPNQDRIGGKPGEHVEIDETWVGGRTRGEGRGVHHKVARRLCRRGSSSETGNRAGQAKGRTLCRACQARRSTRFGAPTRFVGSWRAPLLRGRCVTDDWSGYASLGKRV